MSAVAEPLCTSLSPAAERIAEQAMMLSHGERQALAERIRTMSPALPPGFTPEAMRAESDRRLERHHSGEDPGRPWEEVRAEMRQLIATLSEKSEAAERAAA